MMNHMKLTDDTYLLSINMEGILFEGLWEIPNGVSVNSYVVKGEKTAIIDGVYGLDGTQKSLYEMLDEIEVDPKSIEYVIFNHMEPDHSGWIEDFRKINSDFKIVCSQRAAELLDAFFDITEDVVVVGEGDTLNLGNGHVLEFVEIPNIHWPETIATFDRGTGTLFSCDAFASFGSLTKASTDDLLSEEDLEYYEKEAVRYFSNIIGSYANPVKKAIEKTADLPIKIVAPGHGLIWREDPARIIKDYGRYANYQSGTAKEEITIIWGSMYGMTEKAVNHITEILNNEDIKVNIHRVPQTDTGTILASVLNSTGVILAMPTYEYKMFPAMAEVLVKLGKKKVLGRKAFRLGSYGWSGGAQRELDEILDKYRMNWDFLEPVEFNGIPREEDLELMEERVKDLAKQVKKKVNKE
ncbi:MAG TPA: FprA family A-type flavoprotein [Tissierellaceae bacterium]|nr:FprA family A-type flavoprotein [Tissierellaceae bacterium]